MEKSGPTVAEYAQAQSLEYLGAVFPIIKAELESMGQYVDRRAASLLASDKLSPDLAQQLWVEKTQLHALLKRFETRLALSGRIQSGQTVDLAS